MSKRTIWLRHVANLSWHIEHRYFSVSLYVAGVMFTFSIVRADDDATGDDATVADMPDGS
jgi:hypothetical protein